MPTHATATATAADAAATAATVAATPCTVCVACVARDAFRSRVATAPGAGWGALGCRRRIAL